MKPSEKHPDRTLAALQSIAMSFEIDKVCESPIERRFGYAISIACANNGSPLKLFHKGELVAEQTGDANLEDAYIKLTAQAPVGRYRADFLVEVISVKNGIASKPVVVECDGHGYHERTKDQARRDRSRDREMTSAGFLVLRFTGAEIHASSPECAYETLDLALGAVANPWMKGD